MDDRRLVRGLGAAGAAVDAASGLRRATRSMPTRCTCEAARRRPCRLPLRTIRTGDACSTHLDNDADAAVRLLADLLDKRDQWLRELDYGDARDATARRWRQRSPRKSPASRRKSRPHFPRRSRERSSRTQRYAAANLTVDAETADLGRTLIALRGNGRVAGDDGRSARRLARAGVVAARRRRAAVSRALTSIGGLPAKGSGPGAAERARQSDAMKALLGELAAVPALASTLDVARRLPSRATRTTRGPFVAALARGAARSLRRN